MARHNQVCYVRRWDPGMLPVIPLKVRMRSTIRQFAQFYLIPAHLQHSKFNIL